MAFDWAATFAPPASISGFTSGAVTDIDEWPFSHTDTAYQQHAGSGTGTITLNFDLSGAPGDKKGCRLWLGSYSESAGGYTITALRLKDGTTTLATISSPGLADITNTDPSLHKMVVIDFPDSAFSGNPDLDDLNVEIDLLNLAGGNNRFHVTGARLSKSPFTAAQEATPPSTLTGLDFACYRATDLAVLGAADGEAIVVWPDASGKGRHALAKTGTTITYEADTIDYLNAPAATNRFVWAWGTHQDVDICFHARIYPTVGGGGGATSPAFFAAADLDFYESSGASDDKHLGAIDDAGSGDQWVLMSGDGSGGAHLHGGTPTLNAWQRVTEWVQQAGNEHLWTDDNASPDIDGASGSNELYVGSIFCREDDSSSRRFEGRMAEFWIIALSGTTEGDLDTARDEWVAGLGAGEEATLYATGDGTAADVVDEADTTTDLYASVDDDPASPSDSDWINNTTYPASVFLDLTDLPGDFTAADAAEITVRYRGQAWSGGARTLYARLYEADETTPLSDEIEVATVSGTTSFANTAALAFTGLVAADKTTWDAALIRLRWA